MLGTHFSLNGEILPVKKAVLPIDHIEFSYGFSVYENIRLKNGTPLFLTEHTQRLLKSAKILGLAHTFSAHDTKNWTRELISKNNIQTANIKIILIGGAEPLLYIFMLAPRFVEKKEYRDGVKVISYEYERFLPQAKSLNTLPSYIIYTQAKKKGAYDALLIDRRGNIHEGTRSNFFAIRGKTIFTPPLAQVLDGVTRRTVIACAKKNGYKVTECSIPLKNILKYDGAFLTNTSGKIVPIKTVDNISFDAIPPALKELMKLYGGNPKIA